MTGQERWMTPRKDNRLTPDDWPCTCSQRYLFLIHANPQKWTACGIFLSIIVLAVAERLQHLAVYITRQYVLIFSFGLWAVSFFTKIIGRITTDFWLEKIQTPHCQRCICVLGIMCRLGSDDQRRQPRHGRSIWYFKFKKAYTGLFGIAEYFVCYSFVMG